MHEQWEKAGFDPARDLRWDCLWFSPGLPSASRLLASDPGFPLSSCCVWASVGPAFSNTWIITKASASIADQLSEHT